MTQQSDVVNACWNEMQAKAIRGENVRAEEYLDSARTDDEAVDLIYAEYIVRTEQGESVPPSELLQRFPEYEQLLQRQFVLEGALSGITGASNETVDLHSPGQTTHHSATPDLPNGKQTTQPVPETLGKYLVLDQLSVGGQGTIYRAVHPELKNEVVIKLASNHPQNEQRDRLIAEGRIVAELDHPGLARVYDLDFHEDCPFIVSKYIRGRTLDIYICDESPSPQELVLLVMQVARALASAHRRGVLHLDVKPKNIVIDESGKPFLIDFGLSLLRNGIQDVKPEQGLIRGTLGYMSPEQALGNTDQFNARTDVFSLGAVLLFALTNRSPQEEASFAEMLEAAQQGNFRSSKMDNRIPSRLREIVVRAMQTDNGQRFENCEVMANALEQFANRPAHLTRRTAIAAASMSIVAVASIVLLVASRDWNWTGPETKSPIFTEKPTLTVEAWYSGRYIELTELAPLETGDRLRVRAQIPSEHHASLWLLFSNGKIQELGKANSSESELLYPKDAANAVPLVGSPGTEIVLLCVHDDNEFSMADVKQAWTSVPLPQLPDLTVLSADLEGVYVKQSGREFGAPEELPDSEEVVKQRLNEFRKRLVGKVEFLEAIAFCHAR